MSDPRFPLPDFGPATAESIRTAIAYAAATSDVPEGTPEEFAATVVRLGITGTRFHPRDCAGARLLRAAFPHADVAVGTDVIFDDSQGVRRSVAAPEVFARFRLNFDTQAESSPLYAAAWNGRSYGDDTPDDEF